MPDPLGELGFLVSREGEEEISNTLGFDAGEALRDEFLSSVEADAVHGLYDSYYDQLDPYEQAGLDAIWENDYGDVLSGNPGIGYDSDNYRVAFDTMDDVVGYLSQGGLWSEDEGLADIVYVVYGEDGEIYVFIGYEDD